MKLYKYLYYRLYSWNLEKWGEKDMPQWNALFGASFMMLLNLGLLALFLQYLEINLFVLESLPKYEIIIIMMTLFGLNYFLFIHNDKYKSIVDEFKNESTKEKKIGVLLIWSYVILSFLLFFGGAILIGKI